MFIGEFVGILLGNFIFVVIFKRNYLKSYSIKAIRVKNQSHTLMKKSTSIVSKVSLGLFISAGLFSCNTGTTAKTTSSSDSTNSSSTLAQEVAYVNSDSLLNNYEYFKDVRVKFEEKAKKTQADLQSKGNAFQKEVEEYQKNAGTMSADQRQNTEERLARKQDELGKLNQNASSSLAQDESEENEKLYNKIAEYLKKHSEEKGYKLVLTYSKSNPTVLYADASLEITNEVIKGLNGEYTKEKK